MKIPLPLSALALPTILWASTGLAQDIHDPNTQLLIDMVDDTGDRDEAAIEAKLGVDIRLNSIHSADERFFIADLPAGLSMEEALAKLKGDPRIEHAEPNHIYRALDEGLPTPNDPRWSEQWSFRMVDAPAAWDRGATGEGVVVAVIDTGVAYENHKGFKRVEDLNQTKFVKGYDFVKDSDHANDDHGHGTHVAGTIAQSTNNGKGVAGMAYHAKIMPLKVLSKQGFGSAADIADAIRFAADEGAHVINMSLGGGPRSFVMQSAVNYARKKGLVIACAAGNGGRGRVEFPAAYKGAFAVSSVGPTAKLAFYSSYGKQIAIAAPGGDKQAGGEKGGIVQNTIDPRNVGVTNQYLYFQGTSMATPHVAAAAAMVISTGVTDPEKVEEILKSSAKDAGEPGWDQRYGHGILNIGAAVQGSKSAKSGWSHLVTLLIALVAFLWRNRHLLPWSKVSMILGALMAGSGFFFLGDLGLFSQAIPTWDLAVVGPSFHFSALWASCLPVLGMTLVLLGLPKLRGLLMGLSLGWGAHLLVSAALMPSDVVLIPGVAGVFDQAWLLANAVALGGLAVAIAKVERLRVKARARS